MQLHVIPPAPMHRVTVSAARTQLADSPEGRTLADRLAHAGAAFDIINGRAVQVMRPVGSDGYASLDGSEQR